jgi:hypothetical protein
MKKIILTVAAVFALSFANAQDLKSKKGENYLPEAGDWAISFNADGLFNYVGNAFNHTANTAPSVSAQESGTFVGKKFTSATEAYRVMANFAVNSGTSATDVKNSGFALKAGLGKEWRRGKTRLQGFYGADLYLSFSNNKVVTPYNAGLPSAYETTATNSSFGIGAQGFLGAEYFLFPKISIGAQYTYGLTIANGSVKNSSTQPGTIDTESKTSGFNLGNVGVSSINMTLHF